MDIIKLIESKKKQITYFKWSDTLQRNVYYLEEDDLKAIKEQLLIQRVSQCNELVCDCCNNKYHESRIFTICDDCKQSMP